MVKQKRKGGDWVIWGGIGFLALGIICSVLVLIEYWHSVKSLRFRYTDGFDTLGTSLSGTAGLLFTIAGVIFFTYSLYQTTREMKETQEIMRGQLAESTFFNLLRHHTELSNNLEVSGELKFSDIISKFKKEIAHYAISVRGKLFDDFVTTWKSPSNLYEGASKAQTAAKSMLHVATFIEERLHENSNFFHKTFFYGLGNDEKYLLGMVIENRLEEVKKNFSFDYTEYYVKNTTYRNKQEHGYFPLLAYRPVVGQRFYLKNLDEANLKLKRKEIESMLSMTVHNEEAVLQKIEYSYDYFKEGKKIGDLHPDSVRYSQNGATHFYPQETISMYPIFEHDIVKIFHDTDGVHMYLKFVYKVQETNEEFDVWFPPFAINWRHIDRATATKDPKFMREHGKELGQDGAWEFHINQLVKNTAKKD